MIAECEKIGGGGAGGEGEAFRELQQWVKGVKALRYKDFRVQRMTEKTTTSSSGRLQVDDGEVLEVDRDLKRFAELLGKWGVRDWWRVGMGWAKEEVGENG